jgi:hypothetical protein
MPPKKTSPEKAPQEGRKFGFSPYELSDDQIAECKAWVMSEDEFFGILEQFVSDNCNVVFNYDAAHGCWMCSATQKHRNHANYNICMVGRGSTPRKAFKQLYWKHQACNGKWPYYDPGDDQRMHFND